MSFVYSIPCISKPRVTGSNPVGRSNNFVQKVLNKIINYVSGINRVVYDITLKPPSTIELG
jgi:GMP synthase PP-ATPase subunit